jgi:predicted nucleic acid-binding protein
MIFADTGYYLALVNPDDEAHEWAVQATARLSTRLITTTLVLTELGNALADSQNRNMFVALVARLRASDDVEIVPVDMRLWDAGFDLYARRPDKGWSLVDASHSWS